MKIVIYGDASATYSGGWCYAQSLKAMGHSVVSVDNTLGLDAYRNTIAGRAFQKVLGRPLEVHRIQHAKVLLSVVERERPAIVLVIKGLAIGPDDVRAMRELGAWTANINHDDFFSLYRSNWSHIQRRAIPHYDFIFTTREVNVEEIRPLNPRVEFFPFAYYPGIHHPVVIPDQEREIWDVDVVFVGTWEAERCCLLEELVQTVPANYSIWGSLWEQGGSRSPLRPFLKGRDVRGDEMAKALGGARIALGFLRKKNRDDFTQRTFEIPACGGVLLAERTARHQAYYREGVEAEFFDANRPEELSEKVRLLLSDAERRESIRAAGTAAVLRDRHTYSDRLERLLNVYAEARGSGLRSGH